MIKRKFCVTDVIARAAVVLVAFFVLGAGYSSGACDPRLAENVRRQIGTIKIRDEFLTLLADKTKDVWAKGANEVGFLKENDKWHFGEFTLGCDFYGIGGHEDRRRLENDVMTHWCGMSKFGCNPGTVVEIIHGKAEKYVNNFWAQRLLGSVSAEEVPQFNALIETYNILQKNVEELMDEWYACRSMLSLTTRRLFCGLAGGVPENVSGNERMAYFLTDTLALSVSGGKRENRLAYLSEKITSVEKKKCEDGTDYKAFMDALNENLQVIVKGLSNECRDLVDLIETVVRSKEMKPTKSGGWWMKFFVQDRRE
jgi:hypothetical protein